MRGWFARDAVITRAEFYLVLAVIVVTVSIGLELVNHWNKQAKRAAEKAQQAVAFQTLRSEHVCSQGNQGEACRALFDRLVNNVSAKQGRELSCFVVRNLRRPALASKIDCSGILPRR